MSAHLPNSNDPTTNPAAVASANSPQPDSVQPTKSYPLPETQYEEIANNPSIFLEKLQSFHRSFGTKFKVPTLGGKALDLHCLFVGVTSRGGLEKVIQDRKWKEIIGIFNFPSTITSGSFVLRKYYLSLLYHFEQVYYFRKKVPSILSSDSARRIINGSASLHGLLDGVVMNQFSANQNIEAGCSVTGTIDAKFDNGYLITVNVGSEKLKGVLYHTPTASQGSNASAAPSHGNRKRHQLAIRDPFRPKANRGRARKKLGFILSRPMEEGRQVYQENGSRDEGGYRSEMLEFRSSNQLQAQ